MTRTDRQSTENAAAGTHAATGNHRIPSGGNIMTTRNATVTHFVWPLFSLAAWISLAGYLLSKYAVPMVHTIS